MPSFVQQRIQSSLKVIHVKTVKLDEYVDISLSVDNICIDVNRCNLTIDCFT